jgi:hypothetical protein
MAFCWGFESQSEPGEWILIKIFGEADYGGTAAFLDMAIAGIGYLLIALPMAIRVYMSGFLSLFQLPEYVVITTYSDGSKESDHGMESFFSNMLFKILGIVIVLGTAPFLMLLQMLIRWTTFIVKCLIGKDRALVSLVLPPVLIFIAWFIIAPLTSIQMRPFFKPYKYDAVIMTETIEEARRGLSSNSYSYTVDVRHPRGQVRQYSKPPKHALRHNYEAKIAYNGARGTTVVEITPLSLETFMEYFDKGKNYVLPGTFTFRDGELTESVYPANRYVAGKTITETGINEIKSLFPGVTLAKMEEIIAILLIENRWERLSKSLWGFPSVYVREDFSSYRNTLRSDHIKNRASRQVSMYYHPFLHGNQFVSIDCYAIGNGNLRLYEISSFTNTRKRFWVDDLKYN